MSGEQSPKMARPPKGLSTIEVAAYRELQHLLKRERDVIRSGGNCGIAKPKRERQIADARATLDEVMIGDGDV